MYKIYPFLKLVSAKNLNMTPAVCVLVLDNFEKFSEAIKEYGGKIELDKLTSGYYIGYSYKNKKQNKIAGLLLFNKETVTPGLIAHELTHACLGILDEHKFSLKDMERKEQPEISDSSIEEVLAYMMDGSMDQVYKIIYGKI